MVARDGVANESEFLAVKESEEGGCIETGKMAAVGFPSPFHKLIVLPPMFETVLRLWYAPAAPIVIS